MSNTPHELIEDFPEQADAIHALKQSNAHFARLLEEYHEVNGAVHRAETKIAPMEQLAETALRKKRGVLKDDLARMLSQA
jgi:uncharacterized protein YdcH (DUF465 family)